MNRVLRFPSKNDMFTESAENSFQKPSRVVAFRIPQADYQLLEERARKEGKTVAKFTASVVLDRINLLNRWKQ